MSNFKDELAGVRKQMNSTAGKSFDKDFEKLFDAFLSDSFCAVKNQLTVAVKQNPSAKTVSCSVQYPADAAASRTALFEGNLRKKAKYYSVEPHGTANCRLVMDPLFRMEYQSGWLNKSYAMVLTPMGEKFVSGLQKLCKNNGIDVSFDACFDSWFKGHGISETVRVGSPFSPRAIYEERMANFSLRLTAKVRF